MILELNIRDTITIEVPDFIALDTVRCGNRRPNKWDMANGFHVSGTDLNTFLQSAVIEKLRERISGYTSGDSAVILGGWYGRPDQPKDMP